jgi:hypothetical protein
MQSDGGVGDRLLKGFIVGDILNRVQAVRDEVEMLVEEISGPPQSSN